MKKSQNLLLLARLYFEKISVCCFSKNHEFVFVEPLGTQKKFGPVLRQVGTQISRDTMYFKWAQIRHILKIDEKVPLKIN